MKRIVLVSSVALLWLLSVACNGSSYGVLQPNPQDLCKCLPVEPDILDFRNLAKHVPISKIAAQDIGVDTILSWTQDAIIAPEAPRTGRELQVFHVASAFLQEASVNAADCDVHFEISQTADKNSPGVIVETPVDSEFCDQPEFLYQFSERVYITALGCEIAFGTIELQAAGAGGL